MITDKTKIALIEQFKQMPIIEVACKKIGIGRATFYRWKKSNKEFAKLCDEALSQGRLFINDLAESQLLQAIKEGNMTGVIFWLKNNHRNYGTKIEIKGKIRTEHENLTKEQKALIKEALKKSVLIENVSHPDNNV
ncbi:MAG TPA: hypothetical protein ENN28_04695 [Candidatus Uhrbacteria bacterium]|nr:hypothetical protein [Candidatus Uhrbacteria bacterium]